MSVSKTEKEKADLKKRARALSKSVLLSPMESTKPSRAGRRWVLRINGLELCQFMHDNKVSILSSKTGKVIRLVNRDPSTKARGGFVKLGCPLDIVDVTPALLMIARCIDEILDSRTMSSLASIKQLARIRELVAVCEKRKDNLIHLPADFNLLTGGQAGRFLDETKSILVRAGLWDIVNNVEIIKIKTKPKK